MTKHLYDKKRERDLSSFARSLLWTDHLDCLRNSINAHFYHYCWFFFPQNIYFSKCSGTDKAFSSHELEGLLDFCGGCVGGASGFYKEIKLKREHERTWAVSQGFGWTAHPTGGRRDASLPPEGLGEITVQTNGVWIVWVCIHACVICK